MHAIVEALREHDWLPQGLDIPDVKYGISLPAYVDFQNTVLSQQRQYSGWTRTHGFLEEPPTLPLQMLHMARVVNAVADSGNVQAEWLRFGRETHTQEATDAFNKKLMYRFGCSFGSTDRLNIVHSIHSTNLTTPDTAIRIVGRLLSRYPNFHDMPRTVESVLSRWNGSFKGSYASLRFPVTPELSLELRLLGTPLGPRVSPYMRFKGVFDFSLLLTHASDYVLDKVREEDAASFRQMVEPQSAIRAMAAADPERVSSHIFSHPFLSAGDKVEILRGLPQYMPLPDSVFTGRDEMTPGRTRRYKKYKESEGRYTLRFAVSAGSSPSRSKDAIIIPTPEFAEAYRTERRQLALDAVEALVARELLSHSVDNPLEWSFDNTFVYDKEVYTAVPFTTRLTLPVDRDVMHEIATGLLPLTVALPQDDEKKLQKPNAELIVRHEQFINHRRLLIYQRIVAEEMGDGHFGQAVSCWAEEVEK